MRSTITWILAVFSAVCIEPLSSGAGTGEAVQVRDQSVDIHYAVNAEALPLDSVTLWCTPDRGQSWQSLGTDGDRQSPFVFRTPDEGLFGFFLIASNQAGPSSQPPSPSTEPHCWAFVDFTPPVVQVHPLRQTTVLGKSVLQIRWTAIDAHLVSRPAEIAYIQPPSQQWQPVGSGPVANTGRFDWSLPDDGLTGPLIIRVTVTDRGGNRVSVDSPSIELSPPPATEPARVIMPASREQDPGATAGLVRESLLAPTDATQEAARLYEEAIQLKSAGDYRRGVSTMKRSLELDPGQTRGFVELGEMLYRAKDYDRAMDAYAIALHREPLMRDALRGAAMVDRQRNDYEAASRKLLTILEANPKDAEVALNLGDVAILRGDAVAARDYYQRARSVDPAAESVIAEAKQRLELMDEASKAYRGQKGQ